MEKEYKNSEQDQAFADAAKASEDLASNIAMAFNVSEYRKGNTPPGFTPTGAEHDHDRQLANHMSATAHDLGFATSVDKIDVGPKGSQTAYQVDINSGEKNFGGGVYDGVRLHEAGRSNDITVYAALALVKTE